MVAKEFVLVCFVPLEFGETTPIPRRHLVRPITEGAGPSDASESKCFSPDEYICGIYNNARPRIASR